MFERYNEAARRALFFARYEVSQLGALEIGTEHLLLGVMREAKGVVRQILAPLPVDTIRGEITRRSSFREKLATSVEVPFTAETKRVLNRAAEEADRLLHSYIGPEHLLLALLREEKSVAATILEAHGLRLNDVRLPVAQPLEETQEVSDKTRVAVTERIDRIERLVQQLAQTLPDTDAVHALVAEICDELEALRQL